LAIVKRRGLGPVILKKIVLVMKRLLGYLFGPPKAQETRN
jgi:hypothetical protein